MEGTDEGYDNQEKDKSVRSRSRWVVSLRSDIKWEHYAEMAKF